jgi:hypothetical protein
MLWCVDKRVDWIGKRNEGTAYEEAKESKAGMASGAQKVGWEDSWEFGNYTVLPFWETHP